MSTTFPTVQGRARGYRRDEVDAFLRTARAAYDLDETDAHPLSAADIRRTSFGLARGGYATPAVDAALERLEDAFARRERDRAIERQGKREWLATARRTAQVILNRLTRPEGERFTRTSILAQGYSVREVDAFADRLVAHFKEGAPVTADTVRTTVFRPQHGGYAEWQVDLLLDAAIDVMLAVR